MKWNRKKWEYKPRDKNLVVEHSAPYWWCIDRDQQITKEVCIINRLDKDICKKYKQCDFFNQWRLFMGDEFDKEINKLIQNVSSDLNVVKMEEVEKEEEKTQTLEEQFPSKFQKPLSVFIRDNSSTPVDELVHKIRMAISEGTVVSPVDISTAKLKKVIRYYRYRDRKKDRPKV